MFDASTTTLVIFGCVQLIALIGTIVATRTDGKILAVRVDALQKELEKLSNAFVEMAKQSNRMAIIEERMLAQGKRLDENSKRINEIFDDAYRQPHKKGN